MKKKNWFRIALVLLIAMQTNMGNAQNMEGAPESLRQWNGVGNSLSYQQLLSNYQALMSSQDPNKAHERKMAQRWWNYYFINYNIDPGGASFSTKAYSDARNAIYTSSLNCGSNDPANWMSDGPLNTPNVFAFGHAGGWIDAVYCNPTNTNRILIGTRTSGIMRTTNGGVNWESVTDDLLFPVLGVRHMIAAPDDPNYVLAITGKEDVEGGPIYSMDAGETWYQATGSLPDFFWIDFHPTIDGLVFATAKNALWYSIDYGQTWNSMGTPGIGIHEKHHKILVIGNSIYFNTRDKFTTGTSLFRGDFSISGGVVSISGWNDLSSTYVAPGRDLRYCNFSNKVGDRFYLLIKEQDPGSGGNFTRIFKTTDGGTTFNAVPFTLGIESPGFHKSEIIASPNNPNVFYTGATNRMRRHFDNVSSISTINAAPGNDGHHDDYRCSQIFSIGGTDYILAGNDGGVGLVADGLATNPKIESLNGDLSINLIHAFDRHEKTGRVAYAFQDHAMLYRDPDNSYSPFFLWEGSFAMIHQGNHDMIVGENAYQGIEDAPFSPSGIVSGLVQSDPTKYYLGGYAVLYRHQPERFARGLEQPGEIAINRAANVSEVITIPLASNGIGPVAICETQVQRVYAADKGEGTNTNKLFRSDDDFLTWSDITNAPVTLLDVATGSPMTSPLSNLLQYDRIRAITVDHTDPDLLYCGIGKTHTVGGVIVDERFRVIRSDDGGASFTDYSEGLPALPVERLLAIDDEDDLVFCATSVGIYYRNKNMNAWACFSKNLPKVSITGLKYNYCENMLYASTYGRGMWKTEVDLPIASSYTKEITSNTTWDDLHIVNTNILVKAGNTLTITGEVKMAKGKKIMVEAGAKLDINGGKLTNSCNQYWGGIEVWGNHLLSQANPTNQGFLLIRNNALIEHAREAIDVAKPGDWSKTGGIVNAFNSTFKNNWRSVAYAPYHSYSTADPSFEQPNKGQFENCQFIRDDNYFGNTLAPSITMYDVYGVRIVGCDFFDDRTTGVTDRSYAIYTLDAGYKVLGKNLNWFGGIDDDYDETDYDIGKFRNHRGGIYAMNANSNYAITVDHCLFENLREGIHLSLVDNAVLTRNKFELNNAHPTDITEMYQCNLEFSSGFKVEGNLFVNGTAGDQTIGMITQWAGNEQNQIYRNKFENMTVANASVGYNSNGSALGDAATGLQWLCNEYVSSTIADQLIEDAGIYDPGAGGVRFRQGSMSQSTGNQYSDALGAPLIRDHLSSNVTQNTYYYSAPSDPLPLDPSKLSGNVFQINTATSSHQCPSSFAFLEVSDVATSVFTGSVSGGFTTELAIVDNDLNTAQQSLNALLSNGDAPNLHQMVDQLNSSNRIQVKQNLEAASPYLSKKLLIKVGEKSTSLYPHHWYRKLITLNPEIAQDASFIKFLKTKAQPLPQGMLAQVEALYTNGPSQRGVKLAEITRLDERKAELNNLLLINEQSNTTQVNWTAHQQLLQDRGDVLMGAQLADDFLSLGNVNQCDQQLDQITANLVPGGNLILQQELADFVTFKKYILTLVDQYGNLNNLSQTHQAQLQTYANSLSGRGKAQAQNMMCFHFGQCQENFPSLNGSGVNRRATEVEEQQLNNQALQEYISIVPNPAHTHLIIQLAGNEEFVSRFEIADLSGKLVLQGYISGEQYQVNTKNLAEGVYFLFVQTDTTRYTKKFVVSH